MIRDVGLRLLLQRDALRMAIAGRTYSAIGAELECSEHIAQQLVGAAIKVAADAAGDRLAVVIEQERLPLSALASRRDRLRALRLDPVAARIALATHDQVSQLHRLSEMSALADLCERAAGPADLAEFDAQIQVWQDELVQLCKAAEIDGVDLAELDAAIGKQDHRLAGWA